MGFGNPFEKSMKTLQAKMNGNPVEFVFSAGPIEIIFDGYLK